MKVFVYGAGKVGSALVRGLHNQGIDVTLHPARKGVPKARIDADVVVLSVRDRDLGPVAKAFASSGVIPKRAVVVHNAGAVAAEALAALRPVVAGIAQMHPMLSFASCKFSPSLTHGHVHIEGDAVAEKRARMLARKLGMTPRTFPHLDTVGYHAAAALVANGAAALAAMGAELLVNSGAARADAPKMLAPLLRSVADNVEVLGFPDALTGPVRRGDAGAIERQIDILAARVPEAIELFLASARAQLPLARALGDSSPENFDAIEKVLANASAANAGRHSGPPAKAGSTLDG
ncbi:MAG: DUF2520 domain-containing protein [Polyangiaceae bacterium]|nr:DUF2520 domain-containing protein [Polyangiaceae bacterium]